MSKTKSTPGQEAYAKGIRGLPLIELKRDQHRLEHEQRRLQEVVLPRSRGTDKRLVQRQIEIRQAYIDIADAEIVRQSKASRRLE